MKRLHQHKKGSAARRGLLLVFAGAILVSISSSLPRVEASSSGQDLLRAWKSVQLDEGHEMDTLLETCRTGGLQDDVRCNEAEYMSTVYHDLQQRLHQAEEEEKNMLSSSLSSSADATAAGGKAEDIPEMSASRGFEEYFKMYAMNNRPVKFQSDGTSPLSEASFDKVKTCLANITASAAIISKEAQDRSMMSLAHECPKALDGLVVPWYMANDYVIRVRQSSSSSIHHQGSTTTATATSTSFMPQYPLFTLINQSFQTSLLQSCPSSLHTLIMMQEGAMDIKVFLPSQLNYLGPEPGDEGFVHYYRYTADVWGDEHDDEMEEGVVMEEAEEEEEEEEEEENGEVDASTEKGEKKEKKGHADKNTVTNSSSKSKGGNGKRGLVHLADCSSTHLAAGEGMFIPRDAVWSYKATVPKTAYVTYCLLDASNFKEAKAALLLEAHISEDSRHVLDILNSPKFDTNMDRFAKDLPWSQFSTWPRAASTTDSSTSITTTDDDDTSSGNKTSSGGGGRRSRQKKSFKDWQGQNKWTHLIMGLTMPAPSAPLPVTVGRRNVTLEWTTSFSHEEGDIGESSFHFQLNYANGRSWFTGGDYIIKESELSTSKQPAVDDPRMSQGLKIWLYRYLVTDLQPNTSYKTTIQQMAGEASSPWSPQSIVFNTARLSLPIPPTYLSIAPESVGSNFVTLLVGPPSDDGGLEVEKYVVWKQHVEEGFHKDWVVAGNFSAAPQGSLAFKISNLFPETEYIFKAAAINGLGMGPTGRLTTKVRTSARGKNEQLHVGGHGHHHMEGVQVDGDHVEGKDGMKRGPVMTLDDTAEMVTVKKADLQDIEVWAAHWSPKHYKVTAEAVWANPRNGKTPLNSALKNNAILRNRLVMMERGGVPFVEKAASAQAAGALGVVIVDQGECNDVGFTQLCCPGADKTHGEGLAASDFADPWKKIRIPVVLMLEKDAQRLKEVLETYADKNPMQEEEGRPMHDEL